MKLMTTPTQAPPRAAACRNPAERLHRRYARSRDPWVREQLVHRYLPLARYAARRFAGAGEPFDDLLQVASVGLLKALDRYDPDRAIAFTSYALPTMSGELRRYLRDRTWLVRPPRSLQEDALLVARAADELAGELGRSPTVVELAEVTHREVADVLEAREALNARDATSLSCTCDEDNETALEARIGGPDAGYGQAEVRMTLDTLAEGLTAREREVVRMRFDEDLTPTEIGRVIGLSQMRVSQVIRGALGKLRQAAEAA